MQCRKMRLSGRLTSNGVRRAELMDLQARFLLVTRLTEATRFRGELLAQGKRRWSAPMKSHENIQYSFTTTKQWPSSPFSHVKFNAAFHISHKDIKKQISLDTSISHNPNEAPGKG